MSSLQKFKAYFGMVPLEEFDDDYLDEPDVPRRHGLDGYEGYDGYETGAPRSYERARGGFEQTTGGRGHADARYDGSRGRLESVPPRMGTAGSTRGALAMDPRAEQRPGASLFDEAGGMSKITTLRPRDYGEARTIGEQFRDGVPVIMDLVEMSNADAKRLVDFAAGLAFALRGSFDKVATKVFLLSPADIDVSAEDRRRLVETGFYSK